jgi:hypothetical protein
VVPAKAELPNPLPSSQACGDVTEVQAGQGGAQALGMCRSLQQQAARSVREVRGKTPCLPRNRVGDIDQLRTGSDRLLQQRREKAVMTGILPIFACHSFGPVMCTEVPPESTATVTGMSHVELVDGFHAQVGEADHRPLMALDTR